MLLVLAGPACDKNKRKGGAPGGAGGTARSVPNLRHKGAPHSSLIDLVAVAPDGESALSRDRNGGVRLWPALDGEAEPVPLPGRGVSHLSLARRTDGKWTVALVEASGQAQFLEVDAKGQARPLAALPPHDPMVEAHVLAGGQRVVTLHRDFSVRIVGSDGREQARYEKRQFSPRHLRVSADGKRIAAIVLQGQTGEMHEGYVLPIDIGERGLSGKAPESFRTPLAVTEQNAVLSPDGRTFVVLTPDRAGQSFRVIVHDLDRPGTRRSFPTEVRTHGVPTVGFAGPESLMITSTAESGTAWQLDTRTGRTVPRTGPPRDVAAVAIGKDVQVGGYGTWLYVQPVREASPRFLGFESFRPAAAAFSPSGDWLAWGYDRSEIYVEPFYGPTRAPTRLESDVPDQMRHLFFVDDQHLVGVDARQSILLMAWDQGKVVDETSVPWSAQRVVFEPDSKLLLLDGGSQGKRVIEVDPGGGFRGQFLVPDDAGQSGLYSKEIGGDAVLWTANTRDNKLRTYSLAELRAGLAPDEVATRGDLLPPGMLIAIDRVGNRYVQDRGRLSVGRGLDVKTIEVPVSGLFPSWDGKFVLVLQSQSGGLDLVAYDTAQLQEKWVHRIETVPQAAAWSPDGGYVALASQSGAVVLDVADGTPIALRCGLDFESRGAPPQDAFSSSSTRSVCEP